MILPRVNGTLDRKLAMIMGCYNLMLEASFLDHTNNTVVDFIVKTVNDKGVVSFIEDFVASIDSNDEIRILS